MRRRLSLILIIIMIFTNTANTAVYSEICMEDNLRSYILADFETGQVLESYNIYEVVEIASISKLMTYLVVMDNVSSGNISLEDEIIIDKDTAKVGGSSLKLKEGEVFTVELLLKGAIVASGNDAAYALAKYVGGTEVEFSKLMNEKAREIKLNSAVFYNSTGLPIYPENKQNIMTTLDIFKLSQHIIKKYPQILEISSLRAMNMVDRDFYGRNTNPLLMKIDGVDGLKTGFTNAAGWSYASTFNIKEIENETKDLRLIFILMGCEKMHIRNEMARNFVKSTIKTYSHKILVNEKMPIGVLELPLGDITEVNIFPKKGYSQIVNKKDNIILDLDIYEEVELPISKNQKVGTYKVIENGKLVFETDAIVKIEVNKAEWQTIFFRKLKGLFN